MIKKIILPFVFGSAFSFARAQFSDSIHHYIVYSTTGIINNTNNSRAYLVSNAVQYRIRKQKRSLNLSSSYIYGKQQRRKSNDDFTVTMDFNLFPKDSSRLYYWGLLNYDKSFSLNIVSRMQAGLGAAYNFFNDEKRFINLSDGILYEYSNVKLNDSTNDKRNLARNSLRLRYRFQIQKIIVINGTNLLQTAFGNSEDYIVKLDNSINLMLRTWLSFKLAFNYNRNNLSDRENMLITLGLSAEKYF